MIPFSSQTQTSIEFAADLFRQSKHAAVLMGAAGLFAPSGNPDYCSTGTGLWSQDEPMEAVFAWLRPLAELEKTG